MQEEQLLRGQHFSEKKAAAEARKRIKKVEAGKRIRTIRKKNKVTQEQLAEKLFLTAESVSNFENGKTMCMPENVARICELFGVTADYIYYGIEIGSNKRGKF